MAVALRCLLGPEAVLDVVEVEPAVVTACQAAHTDLDSNADSNCHVHLQSAEDFFGGATSTTVDRPLYDMVFMDLFEPLQGSMQNSSPILLASLRLLRCGGLLVINDHQLPSVEALQPLVDLFGTGNVQAVNLHGWNESVVVAVKPGDARTDGVGLCCTKTVVDAAHEVYTALFPEWMPAPRWLQKSTLEGGKGAQCRIWSS